MTSPQQQDPADILYTCSLEDLNCLHDYFMAAVRGEDLTAVPRLWNQQIGIIRSRPAPSQKPSDATGFWFTPGEMAEHDATIRNQTLEEIIGWATPIREHWPNNDCHRDPFDDVIRKCESLRRTEAPK